MDLNQIFSFSSINSINVYALVLLGVIPTIATLISFFRHFIGFNSFGMFVSIISTVVFLELGIWIGIFVSLLMFAITVAIRRILQSMRFHYFVRISFVYISICFLLFILIFLLSNFINLNQLGYKPLLALILLISLSEQYFESILRDGEEKVFKMFLETQLVSILGFLFITYLVFSPFIVNNLWILLFLFPLNFLIATYEGLRLSEIVRFKSVILAESKRLEEEDLARKNKKRLKKTAMLSNQPKSKKLFFW